MKFTSNIKIGELLIGDMSLDNVELSFQTEVAPSELKEVVGITTDFLATLPKVLDDMANVYEKAQYYEDRFAKTEAPKQSEEKQPENCNIGIDLSKEFEQAIKKGYISIPSDKGAFDLISILFNK